MIRMRSVAITAAGLLLLADVSIACHCNELPTPAHEYATSVAVFSGIVIDVVVTGFTCSDVTSVLILRDDCWKGAVPDLVTVVTPGADGCCGYNFQLGMSMLIYAKGNTGLGEFAAYLCTRTMPLSSAAEDLEFLGDPGCTVPTKSETWGAIKAIYDGDAR